MQSNRVVALQNCNAPETILFRKAIWIHDTTALAQNQIARQKNSIKKRDKSERLQDRNCPAQSRGS